MLLIVPPTLNDEQLFGAANDEHRALFESYRGTLPNLWVYDLDNVWDPSDTMDGVHSSANLPQEIAMAINAVLSMNIY